MIHTDEDDEFDRIAHEAKMKGQPYYFEEHPTDPDKVIFRKPQRDFGWKGLTEEEKQEAYYKIDSWSECVAFIESKLKEKNNG
jgi:hypothetical protein